MDFKDRLKKFRLEQGFNSKRDFAKELDVGENSYYMFENGSRQPSKSFLAKLSLYSNKPEEFWLYGATTNEEICKTREEYKMIHYLMNTLKENYKKNHILTKEEKEMIALAFEADLKHLLEKEKEEQV
ncbi:helix-turn-helix domain-containing protein [Clostridium perfringens]|uniref:Helix-turn-helix transcriptional regulator n=2 Tax=Clostridium perfringens TaxID=1502 RepID=A0AAP6WMM5_CLOPF|nr:helix-turn-helix transcriptional regulator [Clostridium perfringens]EDT22797.1 putative repressor protein [Clostridium perfringens B str. ATCC 3626]NGU29531.1 helix-turn-helix transcriptional regulator [Clostridium perfringens]WEV04523.1 helix-turn-helix transcriptional regulator [Clostridium perfringens B]